MSDIWCFYISMSLMLNFLCLIIKPKIFWIMCFILKISNFKRCLLTTWLITDNLWQKKNLNQGWTLKSSFGNFRSIVVSSFTRLIQSNLPFITEYNKSSCLNFSAVFKAGKSTHIWIWEIDLILVRLPYNKKDVIV